MIAADRASNVDGLRVLLTFGLGPPTMARLAIDLLDGRPLVALDLTGDELTRLLAGEPLSEPGYVRPSAIEPEPPAVPAEREQLVEPKPAGGGEVEQIGELVPDLGGFRERPAGEYGSRFDEPPAGTEPVTRPAQLQPPHRVVAHVAGRWRDALVVSRDQRSALLAYVVEGPFGDRAAARQPGPGAAAGAAQRRVTASASAPTPLIDTNAPIDKGEPMLYGVEADVEDPGPSLLFHTPLWSPASSVVPAIGRHRVVQVVMVAHARTDMTASASRRCRPAAGAQGPAGARCQPGAVRATSRPRDRRRGRDGRGPAGVGPRPGDHALSAPSTS
jgi:hypothetical protein